jgi:hypothetical protein
MSLVHRVERTREQHKGLRRRQHHLAIGLDGDAIELARPQLIDRIHGRDDRLRIMFIHIEHTRFVERVPFEEAEIGARKRQENRDRALTTDPGRFKVPRARLAPVMISTLGHWASRRRQRGACQSGFCGLLLGHGVFLLDRGVLLTSTPWISLVTQTSCCQRFLVG